MNPFLQILLTTAIRNGLVWVAGRLGVGSTESEVMGAAVLIVGFGWSVWDKYKSQQRLVTAQSMFGPTSLREVEAVVKQGDAPSVLTPKDTRPQLG